MCIFRTFMLAVLHLRGRRVRSLRAFATFRRRIATLIPIGAVQPLSTSILFSAHACLLFHFASWQKSRFNWGRKKNLTRLAHQREHIIILCEKPPVSFFVWRCVPQNKALNRTQHPLEPRRYEFMDGGEKRRRRSKLSFSSLGCFLVTPKRLNQHPVWSAGGWGGQSSAAVTQHQRFTVVLLRPPPFLLA